MTEPPTNPLLRPLRHAQLREKEKMDKYEDILKKQNIAFSPFVLESTGGWGASTRLILNLLKEQFKQRCHNFPVGITMNKFVKDVSFAHRRALVNAVVRTCRTKPDSLLRTPDFNNCNIEMY